MAQRNQAFGRRGLQLTHPNAAGIDIGSASHCVAAPPDRDDEPVREFASFTGDLHSLADWLTACEADTVAMESTGVYWIALFGLLDSRGFTVCCSTTGMSFVARTEPGAPQRFCYDQEVGARAGIAPVQLNGNQEGSMPTRVATPT